VGQGGEREEEGGGGAKAHGVSIRYAAGRDQRRGWAVGPWSR
jgi:hypothetical protein